MFAKLLPKSIPFFELLLKQSDLLLNAATHLEAIFNAPSAMDEHYKIVALLEEEADTLHATITRKLSSTFLTPIDREDILHINQAQENCLDYIQNLATRMHIYNFSVTRFPTVKLVETIRKMLELTPVMIQGLSQKQDVHKTHAFRELRSDCEMLLSAGLAELHDRAEFREETLLEMLKWMQAYERLELVVEAVVKLAEAIEEAVLKNV